MGSALSTGTNGLDASDKKTVLVILESSPSVDRFVSGIDHPAYSFEAVFGRIRRKGSVKGQGGRNDYRKEKEATRGLLEEARPTSHPRWRTRPAPLSRGWCQLGKLAYPAFSNQC